MADFGFDPTLSAFLRSIGVAEQQVLAEQRQRSELAQRQLDRQTPEWEDRLRAATQAVNDDAEARGVYGSSARLRNRGYAAEGVGRAWNEARAQTNDQQINYSLDAATRVAELRRQQAEQEFLARTRQAENSARAAYGG